MRIRKRRVPFPLSSLLPVPLSDPQLRRSPQAPPPQLRHPFCGVLPEGSVPDHHRHPYHPRPDYLSAHPQPPDQPNRMVPDLLPIGGGINGEDQPSAKEKETPLSVLTEEKEAAQDKGRREGDNRKGSIVGAETSAGLHQAAEKDGGVGLEWWCEGDKAAAPMRKKRPGLAWTDDNKEKSRLQEESEATKDWGLNLELENVANHKRKKGGRRAAAAAAVGGGGAVMEGSRCSRVNGRGWRCCQQTLVGYSLCEHHLGKGRLRSITNVRSRVANNITTAAAVANAAAAAAVPLVASAVGPNNAAVLATYDTEIIAAPRLPYDKQQPFSGVGGFEGGYEQNSAMMMSKRRMRIGSVKARSLSSLLGQTDNNNNNNNNNSSSTNSSAAAAASACSAVL